MCAFKLLPHGFANRDLRPLIAQLLGTTPEAITSGRMSYDLRRLRMHGLIQRIPHTHRYRVTSIGLTQAMFLTRLHDRVLRTGLSQLTYRRSRTPLLGCGPPTTPTAQPSTTSPAKPGYQPEPAPASPIPAHHVKLDSIMTTFVVKAL